jgi:hypothetical protein
LPWLAAAKELGLLRAPEPVARFTPRYLIGEHYPIGGEQLCPMGGRA